MDSNVAATRPQYLSRVTCPQLLALQRLSVLQLTLSKPVLREFTQLKGTGGDPLGLLINQCGEVGPWMIPKACVVHLGGDVFLSVSDLLFLIMFCLDYLDLYSGKADLCLC